MIKIKNLIMKREAQLSKLRAQNSKYKQEGFEASKKLK